MTINSEKKKNFFLLRRLLIYKIVLENVLQYRLQIQKMKKISTMRTITTIFTLIHTHTEHVQEKSFGTN